MDGVEIEWRYELGAPEVEAALRSVQQARLMLTEDERRAAESTAKALAALDRLSPHVSDRDAAILLGLPHQRVTQLRGSRRRARRSAA